MLFADLHIHSRYSRACSKNITIENLVKYAKIKGLNLLGTGDFTHELWLNDIKEKLKEKNGLYFYENFPFILTGEVSLMYTQGKGRRIHLVLLVPSLEIVNKINSYLDTKGRRDYDGRPIFKISCEEFTKEMYKISPEIEIIPAHIWTPYFGVFGSKSGFNSLKEAFGTQFDNIHAIETGMSSDPEMNWKISELNSKTIVSFSDSHSFWPWRLGREATIFEKIDSYQDITNAIRENKILGTIETDPGYGIYHYDGHKECNFSCSPEETKKLKGICPVCHKPLTIGVDNRVLELKDQDTNKNPNRKQYYKLLPLHEIIALAINSKIESPKTWDVYNKLIEKFENELNILLNVKESELKEFLTEDNLLVELILKNREGKIEVKPGYDGVYGKLLKPGEKIVKEILKPKQRSLNDF
ncbi:MAG: endonuclease Q family protein [Candidatus Nanoarchaeia archaeon]|nr:endonuclease Q family protein [Candidatus Nanoarchaeia archaeon]